MEILLLIMIGSLEGSFYWTAKLGWCVENNYNYNYYFIYIVGNEITCCRMKFTLRW